MSFPRCDILSSVSQEPLDQIREAVSKIQAELAGQTAELSSQTSTLKRVELQTTKTNGRVADIQEWRIRHEEEHRIRQELSENSSKQYRSPIIVGLIIGAFSLLGQWLMRSV